jgi:hypothetical protein
MNKEITLSEMVIQLGIDFVVEMNKHIFYLSNLLNLTFDIRFLESETEYIVEESKRVILFINKQNPYIQPLELFRIKTLMVFDDYENMTGKKFGETEFYDSLVNLQLKESLELFSYYYLIYLLDFFNFEIDECKLSKIRDGSLLFEGVKYEFVYKNEAKTVFQYQKVTYILRIFENSDDIKITRIYSGKKFQVDNIKMKDVF